MTAEVLPRPDVAAERWRTGGGKDASPQSVFQGAAVGSDAMLSESMESGQARAQWSPLKLPGVEGMFEHAEQRNGSSFGDFYECNSEGEFLLTLHSPGSRCSKLAECPSFRSRHTHLDAWHTCSSFLLRCSERFHLRRVQRCGRQPQW